MLNGGGKKERSSWLWFNENEKLLLHFMNNEMGILIYMFHFQKENLLETN